VNELAPLAIAHLRLVIVAMAAASLLGLSVGALSLRSAALERVALGAASLVQTIPAIALLAVMVPALAAFGRASGTGLSGIGELPALVALTLYALLPIVRGVVLGVRGIDAAVTQAAHAVGMTSRERLRLVELPLAAPAILSGLRTATVWTVGMATLATPVGAKSLGNLIFGGLQTRNFASVALGCAGAAGIAVILDGALGLAERSAKSRGGARTLGATLAVLGSLAVVAVAAGLVPRSGGAQAVRIGAKSFTEQLVLAEVLRCAVGREADVDVRPSLGTTVAFDALRAGDLDVYVEYTGTAWTTILKREGSADRETMRREVAAALEAEHGVVVVARLGFENAYALVVKKGGAKRIGDLGAASDKRFGGDYEFFGRPEWKALREAYGLAPKEARVMDPSLLYEAASSGAVEVIAGYTTDGRIDSMGLQVLEDPKGAIPPYDAIVVVSQRFARERPALVERLRALEGTIDARAMRKWNGAVDGGKTPAGAAGEHPACAR